MPRSGTSLAEQILASHPAVFGAGEVIFLGGGIYALDPAERIAELRRASSAWRGCISIA